jgi:hypothetical protein
LENKPQQTLFGIGQNIQVGRDLIKNYNYYKNNGLSVSGLKNESDKDIYFTYGDSDVQSLLIKTNYSEASYYDFMSNAFRFLLTFKPLTSIIVISASSVIESHLTRRLVQEYKCFSQYSEPHFSVLRKESTWHDYIEKRRFNTMKLMHYGKYKNFYNDDIINIFNDISVTRKRNNSGSETSQIWLKKAEKIIPIINPNAVKIDITDLPDEILYNSIFVWEAIKEKLKDRDIIIPDWSNQLQYALVESYFSAFAETYIFPYRDNFNLDLSQSSSIYFTNVRLMKEILLKADTLMDFIRLTPSQLFTFIKSDDLLNFKSKLDSCETINELLMIAEKNKGFLQKALEQSKESPENKSSKLWHIKPIIAINRLIKLK